MAQYSDADIEVLRKEFESQARDTYKFRRSRRGTYQNPQVARDWKWFLAGAATCSEIVRTLAKGRIDGL